MPCIHHLAALRRAQKHLLLCWAVRMEERARGAAAEADQLALRKMGRQLRAVHEELAEYDQLLAAFRAAPAAEHECLVASRRPSLGEAFFAHLDTYIKSLHVRRPLFAPAAPAL